MLIFSFLAANIDLFVEYIGGGGGWGGGGNLTLSRLKEKPGKCFE